MPYLHVGMHQRNMVIMAKMDKDHEREADIKAKQKSRMDKKVSSMTGRR